MTTDEFIKGLHAAITGAVEAGYTYAGMSCKQDCKDGCPFVAHEWDGTIYCGLYDLKKALERMGPERRDP